MLLTIFLTIFYHDIFDKVLNTCLDQILRQAAERNDEWNQPAKCLL